MQYQFIMLTNTPFTPIKEELTGMNRPDAAEKSPVVSQHALDFSTGDKTIVAVEAFNTSNGLAYKWSLEAFR